jgi:hypothetical protein
MPSVIYKLFALCVVRLIVVVPFKRAYPKVEHLKVASLGQALALPTNIRLGWKGLAGTMLWLIIKSRNLRP